MTWSHDITTAPHEGVIWLASKCGKVIRSNWIDKPGRWAGFSEKEQPIAWHPYEVPEHPNSQGTASGQPEAHGSSPCTGAREANRPATYGQLVTAGETAHFVIDDVGSGA